MRNAGISERRYFSNSGMPNDERPARGPGVAHGRHAAHPIAASQALRLSVLTLLRRIDILPESPVLSMFPSGRCCRSPHRHIPLKPGPFVGPGFFMCARLRRIVQGAFDAGAIAIERAHRIGRDAQAHLPGNACMLRNQPTGRRCACDFRSIAGYADASMDALPSITNTSSPDWASRKSWENRRRALNRTARCRVKATRFGYNARTLFDSGTPAATVQK